MSRIFKSFPYATFISIFMVYYGLFQLDQRRLLAEAKMHLNTNVDETRAHRNRTSGNWHILMGKARKQWGMLTSDNKLLQDAYEQELAGRLQKFHGISKGKADVEIKNWLN